MTKSLAGKLNPNYKDGRKHGKMITPRLTPELYNRVKTAAAKCGISMNDFVVKSLETSTAMNDFVTALETAVKDGE